MKETLKADTPASVAGQLAAPKGLGMSVAFGWELIVELLLIPFFMVFLGSSAMSKQAHISSNVTIMLIFVFSWAITAVFAIFGEGMRRGWRWTRPIQILGNTPVSSVDSFREHHWWYTCSIRYISLIYLFYLIEMQ